MKKIQDGTAVTITGYTDPETGEPTADRTGVVLGDFRHNVGDDTYFDVLVDGDAIPALIETSRVTAQ